MYGIVNKAIQGLVIEKFGEEAWENIKIKSGINISTFISNDPYDDSVTYKLAGAAADVLQMKVEEVLFAFGEYWILKTGKEHYGSIMKAGGRNLKEFFKNLPNFHSRVMLMYPNITPPEFKIVDRMDGSIELHYYSKREGLIDFMAGLISGLGKMFEEEIEIVKLKNRSHGLDHDEFHIIWKKM
ncbi:MAG: heme NO-binding domain-containing protein [Bacteroidota bacterium]|nr:heme NO-binding domain-containing protein [Bacteroidota bacterium]